MRCPHAELGSVENDQDFRRNGFGSRFARFAANQLRDFLRVIAEEVLKSPYDFGTFGDRRRLPSWLRLSRASYRSLHFFRSRAGQFG